MPEGPVRIERIEVFLYTRPLKREFWMSLAPITQSREIIVRLTTDAGLQGIGQCHGGPMEQVGRIITEPFRDILIGADPFEHERLWSEMFAYNHRPGWSLNGWRHETIMTAIAGVDIALWDLMGKSSRRSVCKLLGGLRTEAEAYATGGYYEEGKDVAGLVDEVGVYVGERGYKAVKLKVGRGDLAHDLERVGAVRSAFPQIDIMLDANQGWDVPTAIRAAGEFESMNIRWLEEPVHWYDEVDGLRRVAESTSIPIASGEGETTRFGCRDLVKWGGIQIMQFDSTVAGGITEWRRVAAHADAHGVKMAPHHDPQIHVHCVAGAPNGLILESFPNPDRDPVWAELIVGAEPIVDGMMSVPDRPGLGYDLNWDLLEARATKLETR
ncbi:MAG: mandelate racemase/muconate lactonizing enzyme family protein [Chloroflexi bacterium]|nr:mandelate racemase/muconate lactonizing enzyme family protein [Chloroflexota bacterium]